MSEKEETRTISIEIPVDSYTFKRYKLRVIRGQDKGLEKTFEKRQVFIGTSNECHFRLNDPTVSRVHARIEADQNGYRITDEGSKNGIFISNIRIFNAYLPQEAEIRMGETTILFTTGHETVDVSIARETRFGDILGRSVEMREVFAILRKVVPTDTTVLIEGESGTGKELVAEAIHKFGPRKNKPFVIFDCSAVPKELMESELFGHVKGAFTGAIKDRMGAMEEANGGTLFLDEIGELPLELQPKLLRAIEKREIKPIGSNRRVTLDVRIICATNRNLEDEVANGNFREDLFFRLGVIRINLPPLRKRPDDIPMLVDHFLQDIAGKMGLRGRLRLSYETVERLKSHPWPGNVRELKNYLERSIILSGIQKIDDLPLDLPPPQVLKPKDDLSEEIHVSFDLPFKDAKESLVREFETRYFKRLLKITEGNISKAARMAGIHRKSLEYLLRQLDIQAKDV